MSKYNEWFKQVSIISRVFKTNTSEFVVYKGFKITKPFDNKPFIEDTRFTEMYVPVSISLHKRFINEGFVKTIDEITNQRDIRRVAYYKKQTSKLYDKRKKFRKELPKNKTLNEKRLRNIKRKIDENVDLIFFYQMRIKQFNNKYNGKN